MHSRRDYKSFNKAVKLFVFLRKGKKTLYILEIGSTALNCVVHGSLLCFYSILQTRCVKEAELALYA